MKIFETPRLIARQFSCYDLSALYAICSDPLVMKYVDTGSPLDEEQVKKWIDVSLINYGRGLIGANAVIEKKSGHFIGYCGVVESKDVEGYELIYGFDKNYWGIGYGSEIATGMILFTLGSKKYEYVYASIDPKNTASLMILQGLKFEFLESRSDETGLDTHYYRLKLI